MVFTYSLYHKTKLSLGVILPLSSLVAIAISNGKTLNVKKGVTPNHSVAPLLLG